MIFGVGAMGCLFGARLSPLADVILTGGWVEQLDALRRAPLRLIAPDGREERVPLRVTGDPDTFAPADTALILTKSPRTAAAAQGAARILAPDGLAITLQNGLGNLDILRQAVGPDRAALGITTLGAAVEGPGVVRLGGEGVTVLADTPATHDRIAALAALFRQAGLACEIAPDVAGLVWGKLAVSAAINPLSAILRVPNGALLHSPHARALMQQAAREVAAVAAAQGIRLPFADAAARAEEVARATAPNRSSMLQDILRGAVTEIEAIGGAVVRAGESAGVPTPVNALLYRLVCALQDSAADRL